MSKRVMINPITIELVETLKKHTDIKTTVEIVNNGVSLLSWAVKQTLKGRAIGAVNQKSGEVELFSMPILDQVSAGEKP